MARVGTMHGLFPADADRDYVVAEFGALKGGGQTQARLGDCRAMRHDATPCEPVACARGVAALA